MFTGLVEETGRVRQTRTSQGNRLFEIEAGFAREVKAGESITVNGCCLTAVAHTERHFTVEAVAATLKETTLGQVRARSEVNLERALRPDDRLGGHMVQGHVDEVATVRRVERGAGHWRLLTRVKPENQGLLVDRGSVCVDGVSLTVAELGQAQFWVNVVPHTWENTTLKNLRAGCHVNIEYDMVVKTIRRYLDARGSG
ncbi:MAG: riboflavin synthase [candidate division WOR-3 bacterium]|nr:MAG: riboflavin synthase [candidate division WOR-3 bacterium]